MDSSVATASLKFGETLLASPGSIMARAPGLGAKVKRYDFRRPDKFSKDQIRSVGFIHETVARSLTTTLSAMLRVNAHVHVSSVDQMTYEEFLRSIPDPTTIAAVTLAPLKAAVAVEIDPGLTSAVIDRLFGGVGRPRAENRELTSLEGTVMDGTVRRLLGCVQAAWAPVAEVKPALIGIETRPAFAQLVHPNEMIVLAQLEAEIGEGRGMINIAIPYLTIEPLMPRLSARSLYVEKLTSPGSPRVSAASVPVTLEVCHEGAPLSVSALARLKKGVLIGLPGFARGEAFLQGGTAPFVRLTSKRPGRTDTPGYRVADAGALSRLRGVIGQAEEKTDALREAFQSLSAGVASSLKSMEEKIEGLARRSEDLADQVAFGGTGEAEGRGAEKVGERPFSFLSADACAQLASFLREEHPQLVAMVLAHTEPALAACVLEKLPDALRTDITERICTMSRVSPEVLAHVDGVLRRSLAPSPAEDMTSPGGVAAAVEILNVGSRGLEKQVVESLERRNPGLAEEIKKNMFVFEDIVLLDRETVSRILAEVAEEDLLLAMKAVADEKVRTHIWQCVSAADRERLQARLAASGRARLADVERAQQGIVARIRQMEEEGKIVVARPDELVD